MYVSLLTKMFSVKCILNVFMLRIVLCENILDKSCTLQSSGSLGVCKLLLDCKESRDELLISHRLPQTCGFQDTHPIVCCKTRHPGDISRQKCRDYSSYALEDNSTKNECGHNIVKRVIGGIRAKSKEFPHMALLGHGNSDDTFSWFCGGNIISENYILTVAHCLGTTFPSSKVITHVQVGTNNIKDSNRRQILPIAERIPHPEYKPRVFYHDIGLVKLKTPIELNSHARPACLPYNLPNFEEVVATGWGKTNFAGESSSDDLLKVTLKITPYEVCKAAYNASSNRSLPNGINNDIHICTGSESGGKDTCQGDTGGPIQIYHTSDEITCMYDIVGIIAFGRGCGSHPSVNTRVSHYLKWIEDIVWPL